MRALRTVAFVVTGLLCAASAGAQSAYSPQDRATARNAAEEADKKLAAKDYDGALELFTKADALVPAPTLKLSIAHVQIARGKLVEAQQMLIDVARSAPQPNEPASWAKAREQAGKEANDLKARVSAIEIIVEPRDKPARVTVDGEAVNSASLGVPRATNPGQHTLRAEADGFQPAETTVVLKEGDRTQVVLRLTPVAGGAVVPPPGPGTPPPPPSGQQGQPPPYVDPAGRPPEGAEGRMHQGFLLRVGLGATFHSSTLESKVGAQSVKVDASGTGVAFDLLIGGMVARGFAVAGDLGVHVVTDPSVKASGGGVSTTVKGTFTYGRTGIVGVFYPSPNGGFHLFAGLGYARAQFKITDDTFSQLQKDANGFTAGGLGVSGGAGYEFWVGPKSSLGALLRFDYANLSGTDSVSVGTASVSIDRTFTMFVPSLLANYTYN